MPDSKNQANPTVTDTPKCLMCGKPIKKLLRGLNFSPATANGRLNGDRSTRHNTIYLDVEHRPATKEEAQKYTNHDITRISMHSGRVFSITWWEGEYEDRHFHSQTCAAAFGRRAARHGVRFDEQGLELSGVFNV